MFPLSLTVYIPATPGEYVQLEQVIQNALVVRERYDLVIPRTYYESAVLEPLLATLQNNSFKAKVEKLGGYDACHMGQVIARLPMG